MNLMTHAKAIISGLLLLFFSTQGQSQCEYDLDENGVINYDGDVFYHITQYGIDSASYEGPYLFGDHNDNGVVDIRDLYNCLKYVGTSGSECAEVNEFSGNVMGLVLEEYLVHDTALYGAMDTIPAGSITYRLYLKVADPDDIVVGVYGDALAPLQISTSGEFFHVSSAQTGEVLFSPTGPQSSFYFAPVPTAEFTSWISIDGPPWINQSQCLYISSLEENWGESFSDGQDIFINSVVGGGWFDLDTWVPDVSEYPLLRTLGQFTVVGATDISGQLSVLIKPDGTGLNNPFEESEMLGFSLDNLAIFGCTDSEALNFDPEAEYNDGSCLLLGDIDGDGEITLDDLLVFIGNFGCISDCGPSDLNSDGVVNSLDLLILLGYFG
mgnify:CR=1 FL=1|jgi:hypothetical protein